MGMKLLQLWVRMLEIESRQQRHSQAAPTVDIMPNIQCFLEKMRPHRERWSQETNRSRLTAAEPSVTAALRPDDAARRPLPPKTGADDDL